MYSSLSDNLNVMLNWNTSSYTGSNILSSNNVKWYWIMRHLHLLSLNHQGKKIVIIPTCPAYHKVS